MAPAPRRAPRSAGSGLSSVNLTCYTHNVSVWYSIEVFDGASSALGWAEVWTDTLIGSALSSGATDWSWHQHSWGVVLEVAFPDEAAWDAYRDNSAVKAALDAVPDPLTGLIVYRGRGGSSGAATPRRPKPLTGSGAAALPLPWMNLEEWPADLAALAGPATRRPLGAALVGVG